MPRIRLTIQYKGTSYNGWQVQPNGATVQEILQKVLSRILNCRSTVVAASRTDSGVHALGQTAHFDVPVGVRHAVPIRLQHGINSLLPPDIVVARLEPVPDAFHAQKSARRKIYKYYIHNSAVRSPFLNDYVWRIPYPLNIAKMRKAVRLLTGRRDFKSFCASGSTAKTTVRNVYRISITAHPCPPFFGLPLARNKVAVKENRLVCITIEGDGFLKHMVRNIAGTLAGAGRGRIALGELKRILKARDRRKAGMTAPAKGLVLVKVIY